MDKPFGLAVKALIDNGRGECLVLRRAAKSKRGPHKWDLPGGKVDAGEAFDRALIREAREEAGLDVAIDGVFAAGSFEMPAVRVVILVLEAHATTESVRLSDEHEEYRWVARSDLPSLDWFDQLAGIVRGHATVSTSAARAQRG